MPNADEQARGVWALPKGEAYYNHQLATYTTLPMTADDVHQLGMSEVQRILAEMDDIRGGVGFEGDLKAFFEFIRTDSQFYYPNTDEGAKATYRTRALFWLKSSRSCRSTSAPCRKRNWK